MGGFDPGASPPLPLAKPSPAALLGLDPERFAALLATRRTMRHPTWQYNVAAWLAGESGSVSPFADWVAFPLEGEAAGAIGLLQVDLLAGPGDDTLAELVTVGETALATVRNVLDGVRRRFGVVLAERPRWRVTLAAPAPFDGESVGLAAALACLASLAGGRVKPDLAVTGGFSTEHCRCRPADPGSLQAKHAAAGRWRFRRMGVVGDVPDFGPSPALIALPPTLEGLALCVETWCDGGDPDWLARALTVADLSQGSDASPPNELAAMTEKLLARWKSPSLVRYVALDIRARAALHRGDTDDARRDTEEARLLEPSLDLPDGSFGDYLRDRTIAHRSVASLDAGLMADDEPAHRAVDAAISRLEQASWLRRSERLVLHFLRHTRARRWQYRARLEQSLPAAREALEESLRGREGWEALLDGYAAKELQDRTTSVRRAENLVIECGATVARLGGDATEVRGWGGLWPSRTRCNDCQSAYDRTAWLRWHRIGGQPPKAAEPCVEACLQGLLDGHAVGYPETLMVEEVLESLPPGHERRAACLDLLGRSAVLTSGEAGSIFRVIAIRIAARLSREGRPHPPLTRPTGALGRLFDELSDRLESAGVRCPY